MFTVQITSETADSLFRDILVQDYRGLKAAIKDLESKKNLEPHESEDLAADRRWVAAIETLLSYYLVDDHAQEIINEKDD
jgi:hypothetical protein